MGLSASYPDDLDDINIIHSNAKKVDTLSHLNQHTFMDGYIRQIFGISPSDPTHPMPECLLHLIIHYFRISRCILLYSRNDDQKRGRLDLIDLNQSKPALQYVLTLQDSVHLNHKMHLQQRSTSFAANIIFPHHDASKSYHAIFQAKNIVRGGSVDAILIDPDNHYHIERTLNLPFIGYGQTIHHLKYSYSLKSLIAEDSFEGYINSIALSEVDGATPTSSSLKWTRYKDKKYKMKVYGERQYLCHSCFIDTHNTGNSQDSLLFVVNYECRGQIFDFCNKQWNQKDLSRFAKKRYRADFGLCHDSWNQRCFISGGCKDANDYKLAVEDNFVHYTDVYDLHKDQWYTLPDTRRYHEANPCVWYRDHCVFVVSSEIVHQRELKHHWEDKQMNDKFDDVNASKIGVIEMYDTRCCEKKNEWQIAPQQQQLQHIVDRHSLHNHAYVPSKLLLCLY